MFELESPTAVKLTDVIVLSDKDCAPDTNPGVGLDFAMTVANDMLTMFDGGLRSALFTKTAASSTPAQATLEGVPAVSDMPNLTGIGKAIGQFGWDLELTGYELVLDHGMGGKSNITLDNCKITNFRFKCKEGGSVEVKFRAESPDVNEKTHGKLALLKTREMPITARAPEVQQQDVEQPPIRTQGNGADTQPTGNDPLWPFPTSGHEEGTAPTVTTKKSRKAAAPVAQERQ